MLKAILSFFFPRGNLITPCYKSELNFNSKEIATGSISHRKKNYYTWFETEEFIVFLSPIYKLRDRSVVGHYRMSDANSGWKRKVCKSVGFSIYTPAYKPIFWIFARYGVSHQPRKNAVSSRLSRPKLCSNAPLKQTFYLRILFFVINKCCRIKQSHLLVFGTAVD